MRARTDEAVRASLVRDVPKGVPASRVAPQDGASTRGSRTGGSGTGRSGNRSSEREGEPVDAAVTVLGAVAPASARADLQPLPSALSQKARDDAARMLWDLHYAPLAGW